MNTKDKAIRDAFEAAQADLAHLRERETQIRAKFEKYSRLTSEIQALVADAILKLTEAQRKVDLVSAPALKIELEQVLTELDSKWTSAGERRVFEIFSALKITGAIGGRDYLSLRVFVENVKNPGSSRIRRRWTDLLNWVHPKATAA